jgi:small-conductance mechanosensitive channel
MFQEFETFINSPSVVRLVFILIASLIFAFFVSKVVARILIKLAQLIAVRADNTKDEEKALKLRRLETYLSVLIAIVRVVVIVVIGLFIWNLVSPTARANSSVTTIGDSALFIVLAGGTVGILLRDITAGSTMIIEEWFNVGDHIKVEPLWDVSGVVERGTLRSTKIRSLSGEVILLHNQHITAVHVTPNGLRTMAVDVLINNKENGLELIKKVANTAPVETTLLAKELHVGDAEPWGNKLWRVRITGQTPPGRQWLIEDFFVIYNSLCYSYRLHNYYFFTKILNIL